MLLGCRHKCHFSQAVFNILVMVAEISREVGTCEFFTIAVLPSEYAQVPDLAKNMALDCGENRPFHEGERVLTIPKGQGGKVPI